MRAIEKALLEAIADSSSVQRSLWDLQRAGFQLRLSIDCRESPTGAALARRDGAEAGAAESGFRIDGEDLRFLRSLGIDPTRARRTRRRS